MLLLTSSSDLVKVNTSAATDIEVHASWVDNVTGTITPGRTNTASITGTGDTTVVAGPASGQRNVTHLNIRNNHAATACNVIVSHSDGTNVESLIYTPLLAGEALVLDQTGQFTRFDSNGGPYPRGGFPAATQAEMEAGTSVLAAVTPARQHNHPSMCKFYCQTGTAGFFGADFGTSRSSYNCTSLVDTGAGLMTVTIATDFSSADWACAVSVLRTVTTLTVTNLKYVNIRSTLQAAGTVQLECYDGVAATATQEDPAQWDVFGYGDHA